MSTATALTEVTARVLTDQVKADLRSLWSKLLELHDGGAHTALGYSSWAAYCVAEFRITQSRGYQLLDAGRVAALIEADSTIVESVNEAQARELAPILKAEGPEAVKEVYKAAARQGEKPTARRIKETVRAEAPAHVTREREQKRQRQERYQGIREADQQSQLNSMRNAPAGKLNLPGLRRAREIRKLLRELSSLDPERFLSQVPPEALGEFDLGVARWWLEFCKLAAQHARANGTVKIRQAPPIAIPMTRKGLAPQEAQILGLLSERGPMTADQLGNELGTSAKAISTAANKLEKAGLLGVHRPGGGKPHVYRATVPDPTEE